MKRDGTCSLKAILKCYVFGHRMSFLAYRRWPNLVVYVCQRCGKKEEIDEA